MNSSRAVPAILAGVAAITLALALSGCTTTPVKTTTCTPAQVLGAGTSLANATTTRLSAAAAQFPLADVLKGRTDVACTAKAVITFADGKTPDRTIDVAILATDIGTATGQIDKVLLAHGGKRGTPTGGGSFTWDINGKGALGANPYKTSQTLVETLSS
jgi:hypothetical protein